MPAGDFVRFEFAANGLNIAGLPTLYDGNGEERVLGGAERLNIISLHVLFDSLNPAKTITIFDDIDQDNVIDSSEDHTLDEPVYFVGGIGSHQSQFLGDGVACGLGRLPNIISTNGAGASEVTITGMGHVTWG